MLITKGLHLCKYEVRECNFKLKTFTTKSSEIVELLLRQDELVVVDGKGCPLLWHCVQNGILTERVALDERLRYQYGQQYEGKFPLEIGKAFN